MDKLRKAVIDMEEVVNFLRKQKELAEASRQVE